MIKAKTNRKARRLFGMTHWTSNRFRVVFNETSNGGEWRRMASGKEKEIRLLFIIWQSNILTLLFAYDIHNAAARYIEPAACYSASIQMHNRRPPG
ncbi:stationary-phase-induced ribosome-associated protein [Serratia sp. TSA_198.1]|uniref:stationary-phase-induced ribosome-associated protein n=1 Tax=Serratia sp. TSA_198.1 TaxID=3415664 RepID=UPI0040459FA6